MSVCVSAPACVRRYDCICDCACLGLRVSVFHVCQGVLVCVFVCVYV